MTILTKDQRAQLNATVQKARAQSEAAAGHAVRRLAVTEPRPGGHLSEPERALRRELRKKATQLGDVAESGAVPLLVADIGYEQWHRLLFARFLEVNGLLRHPDMGIALTLTDCGELADELNEPEAWSVAARFASEILPGVFRLTDPSVQVRYAREDLTALEALLSAIPEETLRAEDALGWVYQFWQTSQKKAVNESGRKIGAADISPVTQLFTENYMVRFLLENSLGAWWAAKHPASPLLADWEYLRLLEDGTPAAGTFNEWPPTAAALTVMDPCCGSGHFLVAAFGMLWRMRAEEEGLSDIDAQDAVLRDNIFGLELDPRCTQIAAFNLVLEAWKQGGWRPVAAPALACSGVAANQSLLDWTETTSASEHLRALVERVHQEFWNASLLGSLLNPAAEIGRQDLLSVNSEDFELAIAADNGTRAESLSSILPALKALSREYTLVITNPPYLASSLQSAELRDQLATRYPQSKSELATVFMERCIALTSEGGTTALVLPQSWLFLGGQVALRQRMLENFRWATLVKLGPRAFRSITGDVVNACLFSLQRISPDYDNKMDAIDVMNQTGPDAKNMAILASAPLNVLQRSQLANPDSRILFEAPSTLTRLSDFADCLWGLRTGDNPRFVRKHWEVLASDMRYRGLQGSVSNSVEFGGREEVLLWDGGAGALAAAARAGSASLQGMGAWGKFGISVTLTGQLPVTRYTGDIFGNTTSTVWPRLASDIDALWAFCRSDTFSSEVRKLDSKIGVTNQTLLKVPIDMEFWRAKAGPGNDAAVSNDPTQRIYNTSIPNSAEPLMMAIIAIVGLNETNNESSTRDDDGIVALPALAGERSASDRVRELLAIEYGPKWSTALLDRLLTDAGGKPGDLAGWLRDGFFKHHCRVFQNRPFVWQVWDGLKDGFSALLHYHRLDRPTLEKLTYSTLGSWLARQKSEMDSAVTGAEKRYVAALDLQERLQRVLEGEAPYDIYVRWKSMSEQPIGWEPDLDDGVRMNIRPFVTANVLRSKVNIKWEKDRGKNPDGSDRINDLHPTLAERRAAREERA